MCVQAREVLNATVPPVLGDNARTTATAQVSIRIEDVNDNCPMFDQTFYTVQTPENIPQGSNINLQMTVTDADSVGSIFISLSIAFSQSLCKVIYQLENPCPC